MKITVYSLFGVPRFSLIFIFSKNKCFQPEALLKMTPSPTSMQKFSLDIHKFKISLKLFFTKATKTQLKNAGLKGNFKYRERVCFNGYSLQQQSKYRSAEIKRT